ncbi:MAG TPA: YfiR family protein [Bryobacteraceae bacterium]|nr:YfiR family protein [Bryobacteraceae bacterium]
MFKVGRLAAVLSLTLSFFAAALPADRAPRTAGEYELKAAFLYNFANFVTWPSDAFARPDAPFVIGVVGADPFGPTLEQVLNGQRWNGRPIVIERFSRPQDIRAVHLLYISESEKRRWPEVQAATGPASVLTVSDMRDFCALGGMIEFIPEHNRLGFNMNIAAASRARLTVSSKLLKLATAVSRAEP